ncbi:hypothetical protein C0V70_02565 [Bacteriovorax stolpii]|uniref:Uncharacterized protein n=1 Tax=Bacteriovorax stolpii TaxID=960 RepID=A0A2K9NPK9_BACTC|nr:Tad domain-containing protein [Bacteriovorax stolpii]AUN97005.1 hypothetical protein C0V70_02565 [Bacteriovorax stolpii]TDP53291.1 putative Flp pilus-assembly TadE/G-like protein [Bacteriovorax stolpii]
MIKSNRGQLSIFMGVTLLLVMGMLAFIVNVGLFVKAKINLQNAVDAAAFSGAATQARQLSNIAYVNWEMRNTYKEWMFKYYILGQMGLVKGVNNNLSDNVLSSNTRVNYILKTPNADVSGSNLGSGGNAYDKYNVPTICIHNNSSNDICTLYNLPGIPRFPAIGVAGISEIHEAFVNKLVEEKGANCSARTQINFLAALSWAYSSGLKEIPGAPLIATNRTGAWPEALELAMRMRNLEMIVNRPPVAEITANNMNNFASVGQNIGLNERPTKAFMSAFRNLGGGKYKDNISSGGVAQDELAATFKLTEISPQPFQAPEKSVSGFLIPTTFTYPGESSMTALTKHYLDLQAVPVNYATMFSTFATTRNEFESNVAMESSCFVSKSAMPVPGYLLGFVKNPAVVTYYAVKGEAEFTGLFFPRLQGDQSGSFKLTAYAAAKPYGGRIGPRLFNFTDGDRSVVPREDENARSSSYIGGIRIQVSTGYAPGMPIPSSETFWANDLNSLVGGVPGSGSPISYGIPNMIYDFDTDSDLAAQNTGGVTRIQTITPRISAFMSTQESQGLYNSYQVRKLKQALGGDFTGKNMTSSDLIRALVSARRVTKYDAANYMIPDFSHDGEAKSNAAPRVKKTLDPNTGMPNSFQYQLFAPLLGPELLYKTSSEVGTIVMTYMSANQGAIEAYTAALLEVARKIYSLDQGKGNSTNLSAQAGQSIHANAAGGSAIPPEISSPDPTSPAGCNHGDMASKFYHFFTKSQIQCGIVPLESLMIEYIDKKVNQPNGDLFYTTSYYNPLPNNTTMTAYYPGMRQGGGADATAQNPIGVTTDTGTYSLRRNFYSTKFVALNKLISGYKDNVYLESDTKPVSDLPVLPMQNPVKSDATTNLNSPFFLDF